MQETWQLPEVHVRSQEDLPWLPFVLQSPVNTLMDEASDGSQLRIGVLEEGVAFHIKTSYERSREVRNSTDGRSGPGLQHNFDS